MSQNGDPFRFFNDAEFASLDIAEKRAYLAAALKEVIRLNETIKRHIQDVGSDDDMR